MTITNVTISGNTAADGGRAIVLLSDGVGSTASAVINNSVLGQPGSGGNDFTTMTNAGGSAPTSNGTNNLIGFQVNFGGTAFSDDPRLDPLADHGGPTLTMRLQAGSPLLNVGLTPACRPASHSISAPRFSGTVISGPCSRCR